MRKTVFFLAFFVFLFSVASSYGEEGYSISNFARLSYVKGDVFIQRADDLGYEEGSVNLPVAEGDKLGTQEGRAEVNFGKRNYLRIDSFTQVDFISLPGRGDEIVRLHLLSGSIYLRISFLEEEKSYEIHTPDASFYILEEGLYRFNIQDSRETELLVFEGEVEAAGEEGSLLIRNEERLIVSSGHFLSDPAYFQAIIDDSFSQWNSSRDALLSRAVSRTFLPSELDEYEDELASSGNWVYEQPYGYVWVPYVYHPEWRPYCYGRWVWYPVVGWNWVSYEPWGWCVYHYGRWHWKLGLGWYWIPTNVWGPAWVHWYWGYDYIGWCPMSYYGYPVVVVNNSFFGHYYSRHYPASSRALVVVHKNHLQSPRLHQLALKRNELLHLGKISLSARQPGLQPALRRSGLKDAPAAKALSRSHLRSVSRDYGSGKTLSPSRLRPSPSKSISGNSGSNPVSNARRRSESNEAGRISNSSISSRNLKSSLSKPAAGDGSRISGESSTVFSRSRGSRPVIRAYPSNLNRSTSVSNLTPSFPSREAKSFSSREAKTRFDMDSSQNFSFKSEIKSYPRSQKKSPSFPTRAPSLRENKSSSSSGSIRPKNSETGFSFNRQSIRSSTSSSPSRRSSPDSNTNRSGQGASAKAGVSPNPRSSSPGSGVARSSTSSSSSRSSSNKSIKKK